jgi:hypothetical protein
VESGFELSRWPGRSMSSMSSGAGRALGVASSASSGADEDEDGETSAAIFSSEKRSGEALRAA